MLSSRMLVFLAMALAGTGCFRETGLTVENRSSGVITNVVVSGSGFPERIESLAAGSERRLTVRPR